MLLLALASQLLGKVDLVSFCEQVFLVSFFGLASGDSDKILVVLMLFMIRGWVQLKLCALKKMRVMTRGTVSIVLALEGYRVGRVTSAKEVFEWCQSRSRWQIVALLEVG